MTAGSAMRPQVEEVSTKIRTTTTNATAPTEPKGEVDRLKASKATFEPFQRLPEYERVMAGATSEIMRLNELQDRIRNFTTQSPPMPRSLHPLAAGLAGGLAAIDPAAYQRLQPEIQRFRNEPVEDFERRRQAEFQNLQLESSLVPMFTEAEQRQQTQLDLAGAIDAHFENADNLLTGAYEAAKQMVDDGNEEGGAEVMRRAGFYRDLLAHAQEADPSSLNERFLKRADAEAQGIADAINSQNTALQAFERQKEIVRLQSQLAMDRAVKVAEINSRMRMRTLDPVTRREFRKAGDRYQQLSQLIPHIKRLKELAEDAVGGPLAGRLGGMGWGADERNEFEKLSALISGVVAFTEGGKNLTGTELFIVKGKIPDITSLSVSQLQQIDGARLQIEDELKRVERVWLHEGLDIHEFDMRATAVVSAAEQSLVESGGIPVGETEDDF